MGKSPRDPHYITSMLYISRLIRKRSCKISLGEVLVIFVVLWAIYLITVSHNLHACCMYALGERGNYARIQRETDIRQYENNIFIPCLVFPYSKVFTDQNIYLLTLIETAKTRIQTETTVYPNENFTFGDDYIWNENYIFIPNIIVSEYEPFTDEYTDITLCTQTSIENLKYLPNLADTWGGEMSVTVFSYDEQIWASLHYMMYLHKCSSSVKQNVHFHLLYPKSNPPPQFNEDTLDLDLDCFGFSNFVQGFIENNYALPVDYPANIARNIAIWHAKSPFVFNLDIDILPSKCLKAEMEDFLEGREETNLHKRVLYIIPCFESQASTYVPSKPEVVRGYKNGTYRQFYKVTCPWCHMRTGYKKWTSLPYPSDMTIAYTVEFMNMYEPFYIAERTLLPDFSGMFKGYGKDRFSQVYEANITGFQFAVMNNAFVIHQGFKTAAHFTFNKRKQSQKNEKLFKTVFKPMLKVKYPESNIV